MSKRKIITIHLVIFLLLTLLLFFTSESLLNIFVPGIHHAEMWLNLIIYGTTGMLILTIISGLIFLKQKNIIGFLIIIINLFWAWFSLDTLYHYHFTEFHPTFYIPDRVLIANFIFAIAGIIIGFKVINKKISLKKALFTDLFLIIIGLIIQQL